MFTNVKQLCVLLFLSFVSAVVCRSGMVRCSKLEVTDSSSMETGLPVNPVNKPVKIAKQ